MTNDITLMHFSNSNHSWIVGTFPMRPQFSFTSFCEKGLDWFIILIKWFYSNFHIITLCMPVLVWRVNTLCLVKKKKIKRKKVFWKVILCVTFFLYICEHKEIYNEMHVRAFIYIKVNTNIDILNYLIFFC